MSDVLRAAPTLASSNARRWDRHRHGQTFAVEVVEQLGLPREISVAPRAETTDGEVPVDANAPHVVGDSARERFERGRSFAASSPPGTTW